MSCRLCTTYPFGFGTLSSASSLTGSNSSSSSLGSGEELLLFVLKLQIIAQLIFCLQSLMTMHTMVQSLGHKVKARLTHTCTNGHTHRRNHSRVNVSTCARDSKHILYNKCKLSYS